MEEKLYMTPPALAKRWGCNCAKVLAFLDSGELKAINLAVNPNGQKKRWRIPILEVEIFEEKRSNQKPLPPQKRRRKKAVSSKEYF
jgi:hypothetical protein